MPMEALHGRCPQPQPLTFHTRPPAVPYPRFFCRPSYRDKFADLVDEVRVESDEHHLLHCRIGNAASQAIFCHAQRGEPLISAATMLMFTPAYSLATNAIYMHGQCAVLDWHLPQWHHPWASSNQQSYAGWFRAVGFCV